MTTYVTFDKRTGQILGVHHGAADAKDARAVAEVHRKVDAKMTDEHTEVVQISAGVLDSQMLYKVDVSRKILVGATAEEGGVGFYFGEAGQAS